MSRMAVFLIAGFWSCGAGAAEWIDPDGLKGGLVLAGSGTVPESALLEFIRLGGGRETRLVIVSEPSDQPVERDRLLAVWRSFELASVQILNCRDQNAADSEAFLEPLREATAVWLVDDENSPFNETLIGTRLETAVRELLERGGVAGGTGTSAAFLQKSILRLRAGHPGLEIAAETAVVVQGRQISVVGTGAATLRLAAGNGREQTTIPVKAGQNADLTALRRAARDRAASTPFPPESPAPPRVENGSLLIIGGGGMSNEMVRRFISLAGGANSHIVILPVSSEAAQQSGDSMKRLLERFGAPRVTVLAQRARAEVESDPVLAELRSATGIWFGGGRQWRFLDAYEGTTVEPLLHDVLRRGGVIGGSSAGASIQAEFLLRGNPLGNFDMMAAGYERGLGFLSGVAIDQHFTQRNRHADLDGVIRKFPQLLGIGIDESTAILVQKSRAEVLGQHAVWLVKADRDASGQRGEQLDRRRFRAGAVVDLVTGRELRPAPPPLPETVPAERRQAALSRAANERNHR